MSNSIKKSLKDFIGITLDIRGSVIMIMVTAYYSVKIFDFIQLSQIIIVHQNVPFLPLSQTKSIISSFSHNFQVHTYLDVYFLIIEIGNW